jgi:hypothetical protein
LEQRKKQRQRSKSIKDYEPLRLLSENERIYINYNDYIFRKYDYIISFFDKKLSRCVYYFKIPIIVASITWFLTSFYLSCHITRQNQFSKESLLSETSPVQKAKDIIDYQIGKDDDFIRLNIYFGVNSELRETESQKSFWNRTVTGVPVFDEGFDLSLEHN